MAIPSKADVKAIMAKLDEWATDKTWRRWRALLATAIYSGFRASELRGLPWDAVDLKAGTITVKQRADERGVIGSPKTLSSRRTISIPSFLVTMLRNGKSNPIPARSCSGIAWGKSKHSQTFINAAGVHYRSRRRSPRPMARPGSTSTACGISERQC